MSKVTLARLLEAAIWMSQNAIARVDGEDHHVAIARLRAALEAA